MKNIISKIFFGMGILIALTLVGYVFYDPSIFTHSFEVDMILIGVGGACFFTGILFYDFKEVK